jgi:CheY-like chemotaxis protein
VIALVPHALPKDVRTAIQPYFCAVLNRPPHRADLHAALAPPRRADPPVSVEPAKFDFSVLVAEDNSTSQWLMREMLSTLGCRHHLVGSGQEVIDELKANPSRYDLLLLDLHMPEVDGLSALRTIRAGGAGPVVQSIWIVALTAEVRLDQRELAFAGGLNDYVLKPLRLEVLATALRRATRRRGSAARPYDRGHQFG